MHRVGLFLALCALGMVAYGTKIGMSKSSSAIQRVPSLGYVRPCPKTKQKEERTLSSQCSGDLIEVHI